MTDVGQIITDTVQSTEVNLVKMDVNTVIKTVLIIAVGILLVRLISRLTDRVVRRHFGTSSIHRYIRSFINVLLWFLLLMVVLGSLGIEVTSVIALFSVAGVAVSLALQNTLSNVAGGLVLLTVKPIQVGHYIMADGMEGTVTAVNLSYTTLKTVDNKEVFIPNSQLAATTITNYSSLGVRRLDLFFEASYDDATKDVIAAILEAADRVPEVLHDPEPMAHLREYGSSSIKYELRAWIKASDYWAAYFALQEGVRDAFERNGVQMTYNHIIVHTADQ